MVIWGDRLSERVSAAVPVSASACPWRLQVGLAVCWSHECPLVAADAFWLSWSASCSLVSSTRSEAVQLLQYHSTEWMKTWEVEVLRSLQSKLLILAKLLKWGLRKVRWLCLSFLSACPSQDRYAKDQWDGLLLSIAWQAADRRCKLDTQVMKWGERSPTWDDHDCGHWYARSSQLQLMG